jgi:hypothetical protein
VSGDISALAGDLLSINEVAEQVYRGLVSPFSVRRWCVHGVGSPPVKLPHVRLGAKYFVRPDDARAFFAATNSGTLVSFAHRQKSERVEKAKKRLQRSTK